MFTSAGGDARIKVIGVGGGGGNAINRMINSGLQVSSDGQDGRTKVDYELCTAAGLSL